MADDVQRLTPRSSTTTTQFDKVCEGPDSTRLAAEIRDFILKQYPLARKRKLADSDLLLENGILDSLGILDLVAFIEARFPITVADEDLVPENFQSIGHIAVFIRQKTEGVGSSDRWQSA